MDQLTFQTIIQGGILVTLVYLGGKLIATLKGALNSLDEVRDALKKMSGSLDRIDKSVADIDSKTSTGGSGGGSGGGTVKG